MEDAAIPRPPTPPDPQECCQRGCDPCILDYYDRALERQRKHQEMRSETFSDPYDANIIVLPNAALPAEAAFS